MRKLRPSLFLATVGLAILMAQTSSAQFGRPSMGYSGVGIGYRNPLAINFSNFGLYGPYVTRPFIGYPYVNYLSAPNWVPTYSNTLGVGTYFLPSYNSLLNNDFRLSRYPVELYGSPYGVPPLTQPADGMIPPPGYTNIEANSDPRLFYPPTSVGKDTPPKEDPNKARINLKVPSQDTQVWFGELQTRQDGPTRNFVSPPLEKGKKYQYQVRITWMENGQRVERTRVIPVEAGQSIDVDLTQPEKKKN